MSGREREPLERFLAGVRRRLWLERALPGVRGALWLAALVALGAGAIHLGVRAHSPLAVAVLAAALVLASLAGALLRARPTPEQAARTADLWFAGSGWMLAAHDQLARAPRERAGAADFVLAGARERADAWSARLPATRPLAVATLIPPVLLLLLAGTVYLLPGSAPAPSAENTLASASGETVARTPAAPDAERSAGPAQPAGRRDRLVPIEGEAPADAQPIETPGDAAGPPAPARAAVPGAADGQQPGNALPEERALSGTASLPAVRLVELRERDAEDGAAGTAPLHAGDPTGDAVATGPIAPVAPGGELAREALRPELRAWVAARTGSGREGEPR